MTSLLSRFVSKTDYTSYEDFKENFKFVVPDNFNFAFDVVDAYAKECPEKIALVWCNDNNEEKIITFADMKRLSDKAANIFHSFGVKKGDSVMLTLKSRWEFWVCMVGLNKVGAIPIPSTHMLKAKDFVYRIKKADLKMLVCISENDVPAEVDVAHRELGNNPLTKALAGAPGQKRDGWVNFNDLLESTSSDFKRPAGDEATKKDDVVLAYFTSGTTGYPKMVKHDMTYPLGHILTAKYWQNVEDDGLHYTVADTGWAKCAWGKIYGQWIAGAGVFVYDYDRFDAGRMMEMMAKYRVTTFCAPPTIFRFMIKSDMSRYDFSTLKYLVTAGEPLNPTVYEKLLETTGLRLMEGYGQTETVVMIANYPWMTPKPGSMGKPAPEYDVVLVGKDNKICDVGEEGEIVIKTDKGKPIGLFTDYHMDPDKTQKTWHDDYYHTGDTAWKDEEGFFWFVGRTDDMIKSSGYRVGPFEVESALMSHPAVLECAITGVPDTIRGQVVKATIVLTKGYAPSDELKKELQEHVKKVTAPYKYPRIVEFVDELPKTISGKIRRMEIREKDKPYPIINKKECKACERCITDCPANVLKMGDELNERGYKFVVYTGDGCIGCGACFYTCPEPLAIEVHVPQKEKVEVEERQVEGNESEENAGECKSRRRRVKMASQLVAGNSAVIVGALYAGCDCFFGYPITPASEILHEASRYFPKLGRKFVQAESEEAAINMVYGAAGAGHRVLAASSGPGMSLKQEGISYIAGAELPCVIVDICRAGPGLGNIGPEQSDYNQTCKGGGHGCYNNIVLAPGSVQEMCDFTYQAFDLAFRYRNPVVILADGVLGHMVEPLKFPEKAVEPTVDASWAVSGNAATRKNLITSIALDFDELEMHNLKLQKKYEKIKKSETAYEGYRLEDADVVLVSYGISSRIARSAVDNARKEGIKAGLFRPLTLFPFPEKEIAALAAKGCKFISVEMSNGMMREDIRMATGCMPVELVNRYGGRLIQMDRLMDKIREVA